MPCQATTVGQFQIALRALERLDRWFFIHADHDRVLRGRKVETDDIGGFGGKIGIVTFAPALASSQIDLLPAQEASHIVYVDVAEPRRPDRRSSGHAPPVLAYRV